MTGSPPDLKSKSGKWAGEPDFSTGARFTLWPNFFFKCFSDWCIRCLCLCICLFLYRCICVCSQGNLSDSRCILSVCLAFNCHLQPHPLALIHCSNPHFSPCCWSNPHFSLLSLQSINESLYLAAAKANFLAFNCLKLSPAPENCRFLRPTIGG